MQVSRQRVETKLSHAGLPLPDLGSAAIVCILIAEDEPIILLGLMLCFEDAGFRVMTALHGQAAIDHIQDQPEIFTCLITDFHMPGEVTGAHVVELMRPLYPDIPMIITTALPDVVAETWRFEMGVHMVPKPYDHDELVETVHRLLAA